MFIYFFISYLIGLAPRTQAFDCGTSLQQKRFIQSFFQFNRYPLDSCFIYGLNCHYFSGTLDEADWLLYYRRVNDYLCRGERGGCLSIDCLEESYLCDKDILVVYGVKDGQDCRQHTYVYYNQLFYEKAGQAVGSFAIFSFSEVKQILKTANYLWFQIDDKGTLFDISFVRLFRPRDGRGGPNRDVTWQLNFISVYKDQLNRILLKGRLHFLKYENLNLSECLTGDNCGWYEIWLAGWPQKIFPFLFDSKELIQLGCIDSFENKRHDTFQTIGSFICQMNRRGRMTPIFSFSQFERQRSIGEYVSFFGINFLEFLVGFSKVFWFDSGGGELLSQSCQFKANCPSFHLINLGLNTKEKNAFYRKDSRHCFTFFNLKNFIQNNWSFYEKKCDLITDYNGLHRYISNVSYLLELYKRLLTQNGRIFLFGCYMDIVYVGSKELYYMDWVRSLQVFTVIRHGRGSKTFFELRLKNSSFDIPYLSLSSLSIRGKGIPVRFFIQQEYSVCEMKDFQLLWGDSSKKVYLEPCPQLLEVVPHVLDCKILHTFSHCA